MRLTAKSRYAVTALLDLAIHAKSERVTLSEIAERHVISLSYLEQLFARLRKAGLVRGIRGPGGGYLLGKPVNHITIADIIDGVNESIGVKESDHDENDFHDSMRLAYHLWADLDREIASYLSGITLADVLEAKHRSPNESILKFMKR